MVVGGCKHFVSYMVLTLHIFSSYSMSTGSKWSFSWPQLVCKGLVSLQTPPLCNSCQPAMFSQPHLASFQPVRHLSSHLLQSKLSLPSFTLTALCASHIHRPKSSLLLTRGSLPSFIHDLKSSAHDQQGYILPNKLMNCFVSLCCVKVGRSG